MVEVVVEIINIIMVYLVVVEVVVDYLQQMVGRNYYLLMDQL